MIKRNVDDKKDKNIRFIIIKNCILLLLLLFTLIFGAIAWFSNNRQLLVTGMEVKMQEPPYTIQTRNESGYYSDIYESLDTGAMEWKVSEDDNFDNHEDDLDHEEDEPGLEPGDSGVLEFRVNPNSDDTITVDCVFGIRAYLEVTSIDENDNSVTEITEIDDSTLLQFVKSHIILFEDYDEQTGKYSNLIGDDQSFRRVLTNQTYRRNENVYTKVYWVWPEHLDELTDEDDEEIIYDPTERTDVITYIANNKNGFFKDCNDSVTQVAADLTALSSAYSTSIYNRYSMKYDNTDLDIGNNVSYVILSMQVEE
ncbi:MAG: hypothetical protein K6G88_15355 [Lachnospiraceae bacterium]|nr:hypothetical protein [Lachnospiraceae bacterium]